MLLPNKMILSYCLSLKTQNQTSASKSRPNFSYHIGAYQHVATLPIKYDHQLALSNFPHQPESHQSNLNNRSEFSECVTDKGRQMIGHGSDKKSCSVYKLFNTFAAQLQVAGNPHGFQSFEVAALGGALLPGLQFQPHSCNSHRSLREINDSGKKIDKRRSKLCSLREDPFWNVFPRLLVWATNYKKGLP